MGTTAYYRSYPDPVWEALRETKGHTEFFDDLREHMLFEYNCNLTMFVEEYLSMDAQQALDDDDLMMMADSGKSPRDVVSDLFAEYQQTRAQKNILGSVVL